jgi:MFS family permease
LADCSIHSYLYFLKSFLAVSLFSVWSNWAPKLERSFLIGIGSSGSQIGPIIGFALGGYLCNHGFAGGWPSIFYYGGILGVLWSILFVLLITESPEDHKFISEKEKLYIIRETAESRKLKDQRRHMVIILMKFT